MKGIYLHGYQGFVTEEKKSILSTIGEVYAPKIDYDLQPTILHHLYNEFKKEKLDFVSGTSLGGILSYHLALLLEVPCLLLNPAVTALNQIKPFIPQEALTITPQKDVVVVVGMKDEIVNPSVQIEYFEMIKEKSPNIWIKKNEDLTHFVPVEVFQQSFEEFIQQHIKKAYK